MNRTIILCCLAPLLFAAGCDERSPAGPADGEVAAIAAPLTTVVRDGGAVSFISRDGSTFIVRPAVDKRQIWERRIIVGADDGGFLRRIVEARSTRGGMVLETEPASVTDALISGAIEESLYIGAGSQRAQAAGDPGAPDHIHRRTAVLSPGVRAAEGGLILSDVTLHEGGAGGHHGVIEITDGFVQFNPLVETDLTVRHGKIHRLYATVEGTLRLDCAVHIDVEEGIDAAAELNLAAFTATVTRNIGHVPLVETITLSYIAGFEMSGSYAGECETDLTVETPVTLEMSFIDGVWADGGTIVPSLDASPLACVAYADADITIYVKPRIDVSFYAEPALEMSVSPYLHVQAETPAAPVWEWRVEGGLSGSASLDAPILDEELVGYGGTPFDHRATLRSGPFATDAYVFVTSWGREGEGDGEFLYPRGIVVGVAKSIYVVDSNAHRIKVFQPDSTYILGWGGRGTADGMFHFPNAIAVDELGTLFIVDAENHRVQSFTPDGTFIRAWGSEGTADGQFKDPQGIAVGGGHVYVTDCFTHRIIKFTDEGGFVSAWGTNGVGEGELGCPMGIALDGDGTVYVGECHNHRIQAFTTDGGFIRSWGSFGGGDGEFNCPVDVAVDAAGKVYVVDYGNDRVQVFGPDGRFITKLGTTGTGDGEFLKPEGIAVDSRDGQLYIVDSENKRVQRFAPKMP